MRKSDSTIFTLTRCGILSAMAVILFYIEIPVLVSFYKLDFSTLPAILAGFAMGPIPGVAVIVIKNLVHMLGTSTFYVGETADIIMSSAFVVTASLIYRRIKNRKGALIAMLVGSVTMVIVSVLINYFLLIPAYEVLMNFPLEGILAAGQKVFSFVDSKLDFVLTITLLFNVIKGFALSLVTYLLYKRVSPLLHQKG